MMNPPSAAVHINVSVIARESPVTPRCADIVPCGNQSSPQSPAHPAHIPDIHLQSFYLIEPRGIVIGPAALLRCRHLPHA
jgi:hypothetical protein